MSDRSPTLANLERSISADGVATSENWSQRASWVVDRRATAAVVDAQVILRVSIDSPDPDHAQRLRLADQVGAVEMALSPAQARNLAAVLSRLADKADPPKLTG